MNVELARRVVHRLRTLPDERLYVQSILTCQVACGTACCIAGHVVLEAGYELHERFSECRRDGIWRGICDAAKEELGITEVVRCSLFTGAPSSGWPEPFGLRWRETWTGRSSELRSHIAADYLEHLVAEAEKQCEVTP